jgi:5-aminolevulinate synthase
MRTTECAAAGGLREAMIDYQKAFETAVKAVRAEGRYRVFADLERVRGAFPKALYHSGSGVDEITVWCSNDYLGMGQHPEVVGAMAEALEKVGAGAGGTRNIAGTTHYHVLLEQELASLHGKEAALLFTSGYVSNEATLSTIARILPDCVILSDELNHASMIHGIRNGRSSKLVWRHNDLADLERLLREIPVERPKVIAFESVYSMDGDIAPLAGICALAKKYNAFTYLDEVHGFIFTTALSPVLVAGALASVRFLRGANNLRIRHQERAAKLKAMLAEAELPVMPSESHIVPVLVGDPVQCKMVTDQLLERHAKYVQPINYPTVPKGTERLRLTPSPLHTDEHMEALIVALNDVWDVLKLKRAA